VIWALFYLTMSVLQVSAATSLVGSLVSAASAGLRSVKDAVGPLMTKSPEDKAVDTTAKVTAAVREELFGADDAKAFTRQVSDFVRQLKPKPIDPAEIREELAKLFNETEIRAMTVHDGLDRDKLVATFKAKYGTAQRAQEAAGGAKKAVDVVKEEASQEKPTAEKAVQAGARLAGMSGEQAENARREWENYLRSTGKQELNPEGIKREVELLVQDPKAGYEALSARASALFDKSTITALLAQRKDMSRDEAERTVSRIDQVVQQVRQRVLNAFRSIEGRGDGASARAVERVREYLNSLDRPELRYEGLRDDLLLLFRDPKAGAEALIDRLKAMDRETVKALLASRKDMTTEDAEHVVRQFEAARDEALDKAQRMKEEVERRVEHLKQEGLYQAEEARKTAAVASWWVLASGVVSGIAAVVGGLIGVL
jgi:hypothetical protein